MDVLSLFASPITDFIKCLIPPLKRQIGYIVHCERKLEQLRKKVEHLENIRGDVQRRVAIAKRDMQLIRGVVEAWLEKVHKETTRHDETIVGLVMNDEAERMINHQQRCRGWCSCRSGSRYDLGRKAEKKMVIIDDLLNEGRSFNDVSDPALPVGTEVLLPTNRDFEDFASRKSTQKKVMEALKDEGTSLIGVYGMGGVGKTTLITHIAKHVKEENLFDEVAMTTVSQNVDLKRMQNEIAEHLGLNRLKEMDSASARATLLSNRLKQDKRILLILDDVWSTNLNLSDVGIPYGENYNKGCKVVITTRRLDVCNSLRCQKNINVQLLSEKESWCLFKKNAGDDVDSPVLQSVAKEIVKECEGLPIALVTLGKALRNKDKFVWDDAALQLKRSNFPCIEEGINSAVFSSIKLSYDYLGNEMTKKCFLLCCLFPEDHNIKMHELMVYAMGDDGIFDDSMTLAQASGRLFAIIDKLLASCLLLVHKSDEDGILLAFCSMLGLKKREEAYEAIRMHDIIRHVAVLIASEKGSGFFVKAGASLSDWPERIRLLSSSTTGECIRRISLMENLISALPEEPELPNLLSLSLNKNRTLTVIPDNFFRRMPSLATLDLSETGISSLPSSLSFLLNLRTLYLESCMSINNQSTNFSLIGRLKNLVILSLEKCDLHRLPEELRGLTNLRALNLSYNRDLEIIPPNVISSFSRLEYLNFTGCNKIQFVESGNTSNASVAEIASLPYLTNLSLYTGNEHEKYPVDHVYGYIERFLVDFCDDNVINPIPWFIPKCELTATLPACRSIKDLIQKVAKLDLSRCNGLKSMGQLVLGTGFNNLTWLDLSTCSDMEYFVDVEKEEIPRNAFVNLVILSFSSMKKLKCVCYGPVPIGFLRNLKHLTLKDCENMVSVLDPNLVKRVPNLEYLRVDGCGMLKEVFNFEERGSSSQMINDQEEILSTADAVTFSRLNSISLYELENVETIWKGQIPFRFLENLKEMEISCCYKLRRLFSLSMARNLEKLEKLKVGCCDSMVKIIMSSDDDHDRRIVVDDEGQGMMTIFPSLKHLDITSCNSLKQLWDYGENSSSAVLDFPPTGKTVLDFPNLERLKVRRCENLKWIFLTHRCTLQLREIKGNSEEWFHKVLDWEDPNDKLRVQPLFKKKARVDDGKNQRLGVDKRTSRCLRHGVYRKEVLC